jgi:hypothetical protein
MEEDKLHIDKRLMRLHDAATKYSGSVNAAVAEQLKGSHPSPCAGGALYRLGAETLTFHQAVLVLCATGWASCSAPILRTMLDLSLSTAIIVECPEEAELRGFRCTGFFLKAMLSRDDGDESFRDHLRAQVEAGIERLNGGDQLRARRFIFNDRLPAYWYAPDYYRRPKEAADKLFNPEMAQCYTTLSSAAHGGLLGLGLLRDQPDVIHPNRRHDPDSLSLALRFSIRIVIEQARGRDQFELGGQLLGLYNKLLKRLLEYSSS